MGSSESADMNYIQTGLEKHIQGRLDEAVADYLHISATSPDYPHALNLMGVAALQKGVHTEAVELIRRAIALNEREPEFHSNLGEALRGIGRFEEAAECQRRALAIDSSYGYAHNNLGLVLESLGRLEEARDAYRAATSCAPDHVKAWKNLARICMALGETAESEMCERHTGVLNPVDAAVSCYIGTTMKRLGRWDEAREYFCRAIELRPDHVIGYNHLGALYQDLGYFDEAAACFVNALNMEPENRETLNNLGSIRKEQGRLLEAADCFRKSLAVRDDDGIRIKLAILVPIIPESSARITDLRADMARNLAELTSRKPAIPDPLAQVGTTTFYLSYHGDCNRKLHSDLAHFHEQACPGLLHIAPHCHRPPSAREKIKVGFISSFMKQHSIGKTTAGLFAAISRDEFELHAIFAPPFVDDDLARFIAGHADQATFLGGSLPEAHRQISGLELDILFYQDIGMDPYTYFLAFARLAPVQCVSFGHPDTTGIRAMDYFISSDLFEPEGADGHYSEELFLLHGLGTLAYYSRPAVPQPGKSRSDFGLPDDVPVYICPQALFKIHPEFDLILAGILRRDSAGLLVLLESNVADLTRLLKKRLMLAGPDVFERILFLPQQGHDDFMSLLHVADVMLDTIHFNGMNTNLEAFSVGTPVVTMPTLFQRGRHTLGMYRKMGISDCIAATPDHYVEIAVRLGGDRNLRDEVKARILAASPRLYEDRQVVREFERFFREAVERADRDRKRALYSGEVRYEGQPLRGYR